MKKFFSLIFALLLLVSSVSSISWVTKPTIITIYNGSTTNVTTIYNYTNYVNPPGLYESSGVFYLNTSYTDTLYASISLSLLLVDLQLNITNLNTSLTNKINDKADPGDCAAGTVVQNTTTSGVQCIAVSTSSGDFIPNDNSLQLNITNLNVSLTGMFSGYLTIGNGNSLQSNISNLNVSLTAKDNRLQDDNTTQATLISQLQASNLSVSGRVSTLETSNTTQALNIAALIDSNSSKTTQINGVASNLSTEITNRASNDGSLQTNITNLNTSLTNNFANYLTTGNGASLQTNITNLNSSLRVEFLANDNRLQTNITNVNSTLMNEITNRLSNDNSLQTNISNVNLTLMSLNRVSSTQCSGTDQMTNVTYNPFTGVISSVCTAQGSGGGMTNWIISNGTLTETITETERVNITGGTGIAVTQSGSQLTIINTASGTGTVTSVTANASGLLGGTITESGSIALNETYINAKWNETSLFANYYLATNGNDLATNITNTYTFIRGQDTSLQLNITNLNTSLTNNFANYYSKTFGDLLALNITNLFGRTDSLANNDSNIYTFIRSQDTNLQLNITNLNISLTAYAYPKTLGDLVATNVTNLFGQTSSLANNDTTLRSALVNTNNTVNALVTSNGTLATHISGVATNLTNLNSSTLKTSGGEIINLNVTGYLNMTTSCIGLPGGSRFCGNSTCGILYSPNGLTITESCN